MAIDTANEKALTSTVHVFNIVYSIKMRKTNGVNLGVSLNSIKTIIGHISSQRLCFLKLL